MDDVRLNRRLFALVMIVFLPTLRAQSVCVTCPTTTFTCLNGTAVCAMKNPSCTVADGACVTPARFCQPVGRGKCARDASCHCDITILSPTSQTLVNQPVLVTFSISNGLGADAIHTLRTLRSEIDWGDGTKTSVGADTVTLSHTYGNAGAYAISAVTNARFKTNTSRCSYGCQSSGNARIIVAATTAEYESHPTFTSGEQWSGEGKEWSPWYVLRTGPAPPGMYLADARFVLVGDRSCGSWAECREIAHSPYGASWEFRMQGHDESKELTSFFVTISEQPKLNDPKTWPRVQITLSGKKATSTGIIEAVHKPEPPPSLPPTISWSKTREEWSGHGSDWSPWYTITSEPTPPRYALSGVAFHLTGDRQCGAWAECRQTANDGTTVTYIFRMQGHDDQTEFVDGKIQGKAAASAGILTTTYTLTSPITAPTIAPPVFPTTHTVVRGDCLARIAQHYYGIQAWEWIHEANRDHIKNPNRIYPGQLFSIPDPTHPITAPGKKRRTP